MPSKITKRTIKQIGGKSKKNVKKINKKSSGKIQKKIMLTKKRLFKKYIGGGAGVKKKFTDVYNKNNKIYIYADVPDRRKSLYKDDLYNKTGVKDTIVIEDILYEISEIKSNKLIEFDKQFVKYYGDDNNKEKYTIIETEKGKGKKDEKDIISIFKKKMEENKIDEELLKDARARLVAEAEPEAEPTPSPTQSQSQSQSQSHSQSQSESNSEENLSSGEEEEHDEEEKMSELPVVETKGVEAAEKKKKEEDEISVDEDVEDDEEEEKAVNISNDEADFDRDVNRNVQDLGAVAEPINQYSTRVSKKYPCQVSYYIGFWNRDIIAKRPNHLFVFSENENAYQKTLQGHTDEQHTTQANIRGETNAFAFVCGRDYGFDGGWRDNEHLQQCDVRLKRDVSRLATELTKYERIVFSSGGMGRGIYKYDKPETGSTQILKKIEDTLFRNFGYTYPPVEEDVDKEEEDETTDDNLDMSDIQRDENSVFRQYGRREMGDGEQEQEQEEQAQEEAEAEEAAPNQSAPNQSEAEAEAKDDDRDEEKQAKKLLESINKNLNKYDKDKISKKYEASKHTYSLIEQYNDDEGEFDEDRFDKFDYKIGLIVKSVSANKDTIESAWKRFHTLIDTKTSANSSERKYCLWSMTNKLINDIRILNLFLFKKAVAYFLSFVMAQYKEEYESIFNACFHHHVPFTVPYLGNSLHDLILKDSTFDALKPSKERCLALGYRRVERILPYVQVFDDDMFEPEEAYFLRMTSQWQVYAAFMTIKNRKQVEEEPEEPVEVEEEESPNPFVRALAQQQQQENKPYIWATFQNPIGIGTGECAELLRNLISLPEYVYPEICAILVSILPIIGHDMLLDKYSDTFKLIVEFIKIKQLVHSDISSTTRMNSWKKLKIFYEHSITLSNGQMVIEQHEDSQLIKTTRETTLRALAEGRDGGRGGEKKNKGNKKTKIIVKKIIVKKIVRKHRGIVQIGGNKGRLRKGYKFSGQKLKSGLPQIIKCRINKF